MRSDHTAFAYIFEGSGLIPSSPDESLGNGSLVLFGDGDEVTFRASDRGMRLLLISGKPLHEPIAWRGPIVMNTDARAGACFQGIPGGDIYQVKWEMREEIIIYNDGWVAYTLTN